MFSALSASRRFARLHQDHDILMWRYATEQSERRRQVIGYRLLALKLKQSLLGAFYGALLGNDVEEPRLKDAIVQARSLSPQAAVNRALLMRDTIEKWEEAKTKNDFSVVSESLQSLVDSIREEARYKADQMGLDSPYEALLQSKTPGFSMADFEQWAEELEDFSGRTRAALAGNARGGSFDFSMKKGEQIRLQNNLLRKLGYDFQRGEVKEAPHPLCLGMSDDVRIGMRYFEDDFTGMILTVAHEGGHALYRQGLPQAGNNTLLGQIAGIGMDEAMALLMENHVWRNEAFLNALADDINTAIPGMAVNGRELYEHATRISGEPIRTSADEVRYPLDVILRYRIEKALIDGDMTAADIPAYWAQEYERMTGMAVESDLVEGPLQDIHWFGGEFGWFPNYLVGQLAAAQLFAQACVDDPDIETGLANGDPEPLKEWLQENIYRHGAEYDSFQLVEKATGRPLDIHAWKRHIEDRYIRPLRAPVPFPAPRHNPP